MTEGNRDSIPVETNRMNSDIFRTRILTAVGIAGGVIALALLLYGTAHVLLLLFIGLLLAVGLRTSSHWVHTHSPLSEGIALGVVIAVLLLVLVILGLLIGPNLSAQIQQLSDRIPTSLGQVEQMLEELGVSRGIIMAIPEDAQLRELLQSNGSNIFARITGIFSSSVSLIGDMILLLFTALFLAIEPKTYINGIAALFPPTYRSRSKEVMLSVGDTLANWLLTRFISMIAIGIMTTLGLMLINVPLELGLGIIAGLMAFIPLVGPFLALIPAFLVALLQSPEAALSVTLLYLLVQGADNYILTPIVVKETIRMPPALIIVAQMVLGVLFGRIGLIVAAPLAAAMMTLTQLVYVEDFLQRGHATDD